LGKPQAVETARQRTLRVGARLEQEAVAGAGSKPAVVTKSIALSIDGGHVRAARQYQGRTFEVLLVQVSNHEGKRVIFASVPAEATSQTRQLRGVLHGLGATPATPVTILSDGAAGPRLLGEAASPGPTHHVLDWFHFAMRVQHVAQAATSGPNTTESDRNAGDRLTETIERIRWRLWHGQVKRALDLIAETVAAMNVAAGDKSPIAAAARKVARLLGDLETYVSGQSDIIIDYAPTRRREEPISTAITESTVQWLLHRRMNAQQQMRWSPRGAHLMLKVRTTVVNGTLNRDYGVAERWARRPFRRAA
ncbi:MAG TPA: ISKra4 family transposase, partial [Acetobacteraceae bacterium]|nr:ISKra4 family transposase [Acetobacteraceae bacterium]